MTITTIENNLLSSSSKAKNGSVKVLILNTNHIVAESQSQVKSQTMANCFHEDGFGVVKSAQKVGNQLQSKE